MVEGSHADKRHHSEAVLGESNHSDNSRCVGPNRAKYLVAVLQQRHAEAVKTIQTENGDLARSWLCKKSNTMMEHRNLVATRNVFHSARDAVLVQRVKF